MRRMDRLNPLVILFRRESRAIANEPHVTNISDMNELETSKGIIEAIQYTAKQSYIMI